MTLTRTRPLASVVALAAATVLASSIPTATADAAPSRTPLGTERYAGSDRYETAARTALASYDDAETVVLARGDAFPDGLAASFLAGLEDAPILLTQSDDLPAATAHAIDELDAEEVIVVGGPAAVGRAVVAQLDDLVDDVDRLQGRDRFDTAAVLAGLADRAGTLSDLSGRSDDDLATAIVASGRNFPDALAAGPLAHAAGVPILLTEADTLPAATRAALRDGVEQVLVAGGPAAVSDTVVAQLRSLPGIRVVERVSGADRGATAAAMAELLVDELDWPGQRAALTLGTSFPDALTLAPAAARLQAPVLLTSSPSELGGATADALRGGCDTLGELLIVGGELAVGSVVATHAGAVCDGVTDTIDEVTDTIEEVVGGLLPGDDDSDTDAPDGPAGFPGPSTTGVPDGTRLTATGSITTSHDGQVIEDVEVRGTITVEHDNVTIRRVRVLGTSYYGVWVPSNMSGDVEGLRIEDSTIVGVAGERAAGIAQYGDWVARRVDVSGFQDGVKVGSDQQLLESWIHDLYRPDGAHNDGVQTMGGDNVVIRGNRVEAPWRSQTSALLLQSDKRPVERYTVERNLLSGGNYTLYLADKNHGVPIDCVVRDNVFVDGSWKYGATRLDRGPGLVWSGNRTDSGEPIDD